MDQPDFQRAKRFQRPAVEALLMEHYPLVHRLTFALAARADLGAAIARQVLRRSLLRLPKWDHPDQAPRWFAHHAVLSTRRPARANSDAASDTLAGPAPKPRYTAFLRALRGLPHQQREAFLLHDCEALDLRQTSAAMDCSTQAASTHLEAARSELRLIAGSDYASVAAALKRTYLHLTPDEQLILPTVRSQIHRHLWPRRIKTVLKLLIVLSILATLYWCLSKLGLIPQSYRSPRS